MNRSTKLFLVILLGCAFGVAGFFVYQSVLRGSISDFYTEVDRVVDERGERSALVAFVRVEEYDSIRIIRVADRIIEQAMEINTLRPEKQRRFLLHFFVDSDTGRLTQEMIDELAYTNPSIEDPRSLLRVVDSGYVLQADFAPRAAAPNATKVQRTQFYMPRAGVRAKDIK